MLTSSFQEGQHDVVVTIGDATAPAFRAVLRYLYTDTLECDEECVVDVMRKAREYDLRHLLKLCTAFCRDKLVALSQHSWERTLALALRYTEAIPPSDVISQLELADERKLLSYLHELFRITYLG